MKFLEPGDSRFCQRAIDTRYYASYFQLEQERLHIELWDAQPIWKLNEFKAYCSVPLIDIVDGPLMQTVKCQEYTDGFKPGRVVATINMMVNLSEIWDFKLDFMDWKTTSLA